MVRGLLVPVGSVLFLTCPAGPPPLVPTAPANYELTYSKRLTDYEQGNPAVFVGTFSLSEKGGKLLVVDHDAEHKQVLLFDGKRTYTKVDDKGVEVADGPNCGNLFRPIFLPFNLASERIYWPLANFTNALAAQAKRDPRVRAIEAKLPSIGDDNVAVPALGYAAYYPARLKSGSSSAEMTLGVGFPARMAYEYSYSRFRMVGSFRVPGIVSARFYSGKPADRRTLGAIVELQLKKVVTTPTRIPSVEEIIPQGTLISYHCVDGSVAGLFFERSKGSFESQLQHDLAERKKNPPREGPHVNRRGSPSSLLLGLAVVFAVIATVLAIRNMRSARGS
jgi:hypothetical protein